MKAWRSRVAAVVGAAAVAVVLTGGSASAATDPDGFHHAAGFRDHHTCQVEGTAYMQENRQGYTEFQCRWNNGYWEMWVR
ncbi:hypothetical protein [Streptomyces tagetis]|uniref:Uncharacterized protein n=1 Tax=Streptomyces tagetis TaxID=2820809 RepID=A0A940XLC7_9ACTN|nr:hypothetical protein [Streptomyces sp. RG38]MBQ0826679.1 hypothetical protein [Streptomyces sp. RG38]